MTKIFFASKGKTAFLVADAIRNKLGLHPNSVINVCNNNVKSENIEFDYAIFVCPTYGDEELELGMEFFLTKSDWGKHKFKKFSIIELGLYRGYDFVNLGAAKIIQHYLRNKELEQKHSILSLDSVPNFDMELLDSWLNKNFDNE